MSAGQSSPWSRQGYPSSRPAPSSAGRGYAPLPHPRNDGNSGPQMGQQRTGAWQASGTQSNSNQSSFPDNRRNAQDNSKPSHTYLQTGQQSAYGRPSPPSSVQSHQSERAKATPPHPTASAGQWQNSPWQFKATAHSSQFKEDTPKVGPTNPTTQPQKSAVVADNSLRILTSVIGGMKYWSQYKDRAHFLFELFATLDSAVTAGSHGAKNFLLRDGQDSVHCVFYETDQDLPRLIRGQPHRCVGTYDVGRGLLTCVSVRPASPSEQRNTQESVKASDAEMRQLVRTLSEM
ncbi:hypothetical protein AAFF_G00272610 [Aldrovandia affinis]|uniref:Spermatogenesis-associated protein 22 n=1 Tax=Aldrovandia affinis TaxID=143900 RepID=A0AAD7RAX1_9TELE|nr:hypothetical protein AAFF_G00272610 [Aldrovandia affinis]